MLMSSNDQVGILAKLASILPKIRTPISLCGLVAIVAALILIKISPSGAVDTAGFGILLLVFGQVFPQLQSLPERARAPFLLKSLLLFVSAFGLMAYRGVLVANDLRSKAVEAPHYSPAEQKLVDLHSELDQIRARYLSNKGQQEDIPQVNKDARQLAQRILAVDDASLSPGIQIYKYEAAAYSWSIVAGSQSESSAKLKSVAEIFSSCNEADTRIKGILRPGPYSKTVQDTRDWLIKDNAPARIQRLSAIAYCIRWQVNKDEADRLSVRKTIAELPYDYRIEERPEQTGELQPCLGN